MRERYCLNCGREYQSKKRESRFCSTSCYRTYRRENPKEYPGSGRSGGRRAKVYWPESYPDRILTENTPYLAQKWLREGCTVTDICHILELPPHRVLEALAVPLSREQERTLLAWLSPRRREHD